MIIRAVYIGNSEEAYINKEFKEGLNIISSDDNNKGKTIVIQAIIMLQIQMERQLIQQKALHLSLQKVKVTT